MIKTQALFLKKIFWRVGGFREVVSPLTHWNRKKGKIKYVFLTGKHHQIGICKVRYNVYIHLDLTPSLVSWEKTKRKMGKNLHTWLPKFFAWELKGQISHYWAIQSHTGLYRLALRSYCNKCFSIELGTVLLILESQNIFFKNNPKPHFFLG